MDALQISRVGPGQWQGTAYVSVGLREPFDASFAIKGCPDEGPSEAELVWVQNVVQSFDQIWPIVRAETAKMVSLPEWKMMARLSSLSLLFSHGARLWTAEVELQGSHFEGMGYCVEFDGMAMVGAGAGD